MVEGGSGLVRSLELSINRLTSVRREKKRQTNGRKKTSLWTVCRVFAKYQCQYSEKKFTNDISSANLSNFFIDFVEVSSSLFTVVIHFNQVQTLIEMDLSTFLSTSKSTKAVNGDALPNMKHLAHVSARPQTLGVSVGAGSAPWHGGWDRERRGLGGCAMG